MKTNPSAQGPGWNVSFWFALSSPLLGGLGRPPSGGDFSSMIEEAMSITPIVFLLVILLFGFDSAGQVKTQLALRIAQEISNFLKYRSSNA